MIKKINTPALAGLAIKDIALIALACMIPAFSHAVALPIAMLNPMLALLLAGIWLGKDWRNGLLLAVAMPLLSSLLVGMPTAGKMLCMMVELATVAALYGWLSTKWKTLPSVLVAVVAGKGTYYLLKALLLSPAVLVGTAWTIQLASVLLWCGLFALVVRDRK